MADLPTARKSKKESTIESLSIPLFPFLNSLSSSLFSSAAPRDSSARRGGDYLSTVPDRAERGSGYGGGRERDYPPREELPVPDKPPFTAFVGNLAFDLTDGDVEQYFAPNKVSWKEEVCKLERAKVRERVQIISAGWKKS